MEQFLKDTIREAGKIALGFFQKELSHIEQKSNKHDVLTEADVAVSKFIVERIQETYPEHAILSEELPDIIQAGAEYEWVIDPIDGTRNFANGIPFWGTLVSLQKNNETILAAAYLPVSDQLFFAKKGEGAFLNGTQIHVNNTQTLENSVSAVLRASKAGIYGDHIERFRTFQINLTMTVDTWVHNLGSAIAICFLANGGFDFVVGNAGMDWDYLAPMLIAEEAGAIVTNSYGEPWTRGRQDFVIANPELHPKVMELFQGTRIN